MAYDILYVCIHLFVFFKLRLPTLSSIGIYSLFGGTRPFMKWAYTFFIRQQTVNLQAMNVAQVFVTNISTTTCEYYINITIRLIPLPYVP
jgi:hypothetical protein